MGLVRNLVLVLAFISFSHGGNRVQVGAQVNHVVGGDRGWDLSSGVSSWSSGRIFSVGDNLWFTYSAGHESIAEVNSKEEFESCDVTNPIKMYTNGLDSIPLEGDRIRYFVSGKAENCKKGLKLNVNVHPPRSNRHEIHSVATSEGEALADADSPSFTSAASPAASPSSPSADSPSSPPADSPPPPSADSPPPPSPSGSVHLLVVTYTSVLVASFTYLFIGIL